LKKDLPARFTNNVIKEVYVTNNNQFAKENNASGYNHWHKSVIFFRFYLFMYYNRGEKIYLVIYYKLL
jgi:hypothetical protein